MLPESVSESCRGRSQGVRVEPVTPRPGVFDLREAQDAETPFFFLSATLDRLDQSDVTLAGSVSGTLLYMSPEQASGRVEAQDERSDLFSLGAILYEILTLEFTVRGTTLDEILDEVARGEIRPPHRARPDRKIPRELDAICMKALGKKREDRYPGVLDLVRDLDCFYPPILTPTYATDTLTGDAETPIRFLSAVRGVLGDESLVTKSSRLHFRGGPRSDSDPRARCIAAVRRLLPSRRPCDCQQLRVVARRKGRAEQVARPVGGKVREGQDDVDRSREPARPALANHQPQ